MTKAFDTLLQKNPNMTFLDVLVPDMFGILRGKRLPYDSRDKAINNQVMLPFSAVLQNSRGGNSPLVTEVDDLGDPDFFVQIDDKTLSPCPWLQQETAVVLGGFINGDGTPHATNIRAQLQGLVKRLFDDFGLTPVVALELEFSLLERDKNNAPKVARARKSNAPADSSDTYGTTVLNEHEAFFTELHQTFTQMGLPSDAYSKEYGSGQFEINLAHHDDILKACDEATLMRLAVREVARNHGYVATFMSKPFEEDEGNGMHVNISLVDKGGKNVFAGNDYPHPQAPISKTLLNAIAGLQQTTDDCMMLFSTTMNAWRRLVPDTYAPINRAWGVNNRSVGLRVPYATEKSIRLEHRLAGADANPYTVCMGVLLGIHHGLKNNLSPSPIIDDGDDKNDNDLPLTFIDALRHFEKSTTIADYLDPRFLELYTKVRLSEYHKFQAQVTKQDHNWYLDTF